MDSALPNAGGSSNSLVMATGVASRLGQSWIFDPDRAVGASPRGPEAIWEDPVAAAALRHLYTQVVGHDYSHEPKGKDPRGKQLAGIVDDLFGETERLASALYNSCNAVLMGSQWTRLEWATKRLKLGDGIEREWVVLQRARDVDKRRFRRIKNFPGAEGEDTWGLVDEKASWVWELMPGYDVTTLNADYFRPIVEIAPAYCWLQTVFDDSERGLGFGWGLDSELYLYIYLKSCAIRSTSQGLDRVGQPIVVQKVANLGLDDPNGLKPEEKTARVIAALKKVRGGSIYAIDKEDELELLDLPTGGSDSAQAFVRYIDEVVTRAVLGSSAPTEGGDLDGAYAKAAVGAEEVAARVAYLRASLEDTWTRGVSHVLCALNAHNLRELGLDGVPPPRLRLRGREIRDPKAEVEILKVLLDAGIKLSEAEVYSRIGYTIPGPEDKLLETAPKLSPGLGLGTPPGLGAPPPPGGVPQIGEKRLPEPVGTSPETESVGVNP